MSLADRFKRLAAGLRLLRQLPASERRMVWRAWRELLAARLQVHFRRVSRVLDVAAEGSGPRQSTAPVDRLVAVFHQAGATSPHGATCLPRSLALLRFLRHYGVETRLRLGARKTEAGWSGHVWLERNGQLLGDREELVRLFAPFRETA